MHACARARRARNQGGPVWGAETQRRPAKTDIWPLLAMGCKQRSWGQEGAAKGAVDAGSWSRHAGLRLPSGSGCSVPTLTGTMNVWWGHHAGGGADWSGGPIGSGVCHGQCSGREASARRPREHGLGASGLAEAASRGRRRRGAFIRRAARGTHNSGGERHHGQARHQAYSGRRSVHTQRAKCVGGGRGGCGRPDAVRVNCFQTRWAVRPK
jgi:hypothetical protein